MFVAILTATIAIAHFSGSGFPAAEQVVEEPTTAYVVEMPKTEQTTEAEEKWDEPYEYHFRPYIINGAMMPVEWQEYLYGQLEQRGIAYMFGYCYAQIYGESRFDPYAENPNGLDKGLCQFRAPYWDGWAAQAGIAGASIWDPYAQLKVFAMITHANLIASGWDLGLTLSRYYLGTDGYAAEYVDYIMGLFWLMEVQW